MAAHQAADELIKKKLEREFDDGFLGVPERDLARNADIKEKEERARHRLDLLRQGIITIEEARQGLNDLEMMSEQVAEALENMGMEWDKIQDPTFAKFSDRIALIVDGLRQKICQEVQPYAR